MALGIRKDLLVRTALQVLADDGGVLPRRDVMLEVERRLDLTVEELSENESGRRRFAVLIAFHSITLATVGWLTKSPDGWQITDEGRQALRTHLEAGFVPALSRLYRRQLSTDSSGDGWTDPRWQTVRAAVEAVPEGRWTTYGDLAELSKLPARSIGGFLGQQVVAGAYRVLTRDGKVADDFQWTDPERDDDPVSLLEAEGVEFDGNTRASSAQRITADELRTLVTAPAGRAWLVRGSAVSGVNVVPQWLEEGFVSLAAAHLRPLEEAASYEELQSAVQTDYAHLTYNQRKQKLGELHSFLHRMAPGNLVVTTSEGQVHVGTVEGAAHSGSGDGRTTIRRSVVWEESAVDFSDLSDVLQARLRASATVVDLTDVADAVAQLVQTSAVPGPPRSTLEAILPELSDLVAERLLVGRAWLDDLVDLLRSRRQVILYGPPGTGKTFLALEVAAALTGDEANVRLVQFHPAYSYEDFFEGYRPAPSEDGNGILFALSPGPFRRIVDRAREDPGTPYVLVIDEINRANLAKVFGELYFLLEYRDREVDLMYGDVDDGKGFSLPKNVFVIGTMNTADRSIALVDAAMRRRFAFLSLHPDDDHLRPVLRAWLKGQGMPTDAADLLEALNARIADADFKVGPSYFMRADAGTEQGLARIWRSSVLPLLEEMHYGDPGIDVQRRYSLTSIRVDAEARRPVREEEPDDESGASA